MIHDEWISFVASVVSGVRMIDEPLMVYRLHSGNTVGLPIPNAGGGGACGAAGEPQVPTQVRGSSGCRVRAHAQQLDAAPDVISCLDRAIAHATHRASLPRNPLRRAAVRAEWRNGQYRHWSSGRMSMLHDLLIAT